MSSNRDMSIVVAVMDLSVACNTESSFSPTTEASLVSANVQRESDLVLEPDWVVLACLILGLALMIFGVVGTLHHFREQSWHTAGAATARYRGVTLRSGDMNGHHEKGGVFTRESTVLPMATDGGSGGVTWTVTWALFACRRARRRAARPSRSASSPRG